MAAERGESPAPPDAFDASSPGAFTSWLNTPGETGIAPVVALLYVVYAARPDLQAHMPDIDTTDAARFCNWMRTDGVVQEHIPRVLLPPAPRPEGDASLPAPDGAAAPLRQGLNVVGYFHAELGLGEAARLLTRAIDTTSTPYVTAIQDASRSRQQHHFEGHDSGTAAPFDINLVCVNADNTAPFAHDAGPAFFANRHTIGYWFWEVDPLPASMHGAFDHVDEVWAATDYMADIVRRAAAGRTPVFTVPLPLVPPRVSSTVSREQLGLPADRYVFLFVFDFLSVVPRKNPLGAIEAFCAAFAPGEGPVLVIKSINGDTHVSELERLRRAAAHRADVVIRDGYLDADEMNAMMAACDCYVSLHRAEGLGLTLAEAMALGKPVIATGYSGNCHFMTEENSFLVRHRVVEVSDDCPPYPAGARWADPDLSHAAELIRRVYLNPAEAARRAECGRACLQTRHSISVSASAVSERLASIRRARAAAPPAASAAPTWVPPEATPRSEASQAIAAAWPELRQFGEPRLSRDQRPAQWLRRALQRVLFRVIRPYWFQQRQFQDALLKALNDSFERIAASDRASTDVPARPPEHRQQTPGQ